LRPPEIKEIAKRRLQANIEHFAQKNHTAAAASKDTNGSKLFARGFTF